MTAKELRRTVSNFNAENKLVRTTFLLDTVPAPNGQYNSYVSDEYYGYDALSRRVWVRAVRGPNCITHDRSSGCRSTMTRTVWDGSQVLHEIRTPGTINDPSLEADNNHVRYTHGLGIDQPLAIAKNGAFAVIPFTNSWGRVDKATCPVALCQSSQLWIPGANEGAFGEAPAPLDGPPNWYGSLIESGRDASGLMYRRNRYYDSGTGRFTQEDPIGLAGGLNLYGYAGGDPVNASDPFGLCSQFTPCPPGTTVPERTPGLSLPILAALGEKIENFWAEYGPRITQATVMIIARTVPPGGTRALPRGTTMVGTPSGATVRIPQGWVGRVANSGNGTVYQRPGAAGNADMIRIMDPTARYPNGYVRAYNSQGQPITIQGKPGSQADTHIPMEQAGGIVGWPR